MFDSSDPTRARQVLSETDQLVARERTLTLRLLKNLHEIERGKFYLILAYSSMFDYCTRHLRYSEPSAVRRIGAARCLAEFPQLLPLLESGEVNPTTVSMIAKHVTRGNAETVIDAIKGKSTREVERFLAALQPLSIIPPDRVRPIVVPMQNCAKSTFSADGKESSTIEQSTSTAGNDVVNTPPQVVVAELRMERRARVEFTAHEELMTKLDRIRSLASHRLPVNATFEQLIDYMAEYVLQREDPAERQRRREVRGKRPAGATSGNPRQIPAHVRDQVFARDRGRCTFIGQAGGRCDSTHMLQIDHRIPVARGGRSTLDNLRLLCAYHNRLEAERIMGRPVPIDRVRERTPRYRYKPARPTVGTVPISC